MLMVGGEIWWWTASAVKTASTPPAAPSRWPCIDLVEFTASLYACSPNAALSAAVSFASPSGVEVPCAFTYWISVGFMPAFRSAASMARRGPSMSGAVMWFASPLMPMPLSSA